MPRLNLFLLICFSVAQGYADDSHRLKVKLNSETLPVTYKIKIKLGVKYEVIDLQNAVIEKRTTSIESDVVFRQKSRNKFRFDVTYSSGKPMFSAGETLDFLIPGKVANAPKGLIASLKYPFEYEIFDGPRLLRKSRGEFSMSIETALSKEICFRISDVGKLSNGQDVNVGVSVAACDFDFSKVKRQPKN